MYVAPEVIAKNIVKIKSNAVGVDGISISLIKTILPYTVNVLEHIFNHSMTHGVVPQMWKSAQIIAISKVKNPSQIQHSTDQFQYYLLSPRHWKE